MGTKPQSRKPLSIAILLLALASMIFFLTILYQGPHTKLQTPLIIGCITFFIIVILVSFVLYQVRKDKEEKKPEVGDSISNKLIEREKQLSLIYNATTDGILLISVEGSVYRIISANETFLASYNLQEEQVVGKTIDQVNPESNLKRLSEKLSRTVTEKKVLEWEGEFPVRGQKVIAMFNSIPVINSAGKCETIVLTIHDITERKQTERELGMAESKYRSLIEQSLVGVYIIKDGKFLYVNPQLARMFGYSQQELIGEDPDIIIHPDEWEKVEANITARVLGRKERIQYEARGLHKDGHIVNIEIFCGGLLENEDHAIIGTLLDVTKRKTAEYGRERALHLLNERIKELTVLNSVSRLLQLEELTSDQLLTRIAETLPDGWRYPDKASAKITIAGESYYSANYEQPHLTQSVNFQIPNYGAGNVEMGYSSLEAERENDPFLSEEKNLLYIVAEMIRTYLIRKHEETARREMQNEITNHRIQEQKKTTRAILKAQENERNKIGQELHDNVNQILASAKLYLSSAVNQVSGDDRTLIENSLKLIMRAIEEIRDLSRTQVSPLKKLELDELINSLVEQLNDSTSIKTDFEYNLPPEVSIDDDLKLNLYRIIQEQINNVLKHSDASQLSIKVGYEDDMLNILVSDNGVGYDPLRTTNGIGLTNMINRVESFNGRLVINSKPGQGFTLEISLPIAISVS